MTFSLRALLLYIAAVAVVLALIRLPFPANTLPLPIIAAVSGFCVSHRTWRWMVYCAVASMTICFAIMLAYINITEKPVYRSGYERSGHAIEIVEAWRSHVVLGGAFLGSSMGLALSRRAKCSRSRCSN